MKIQLTRPLVFFDLESTGTDIISDRIVQISVLKLLPDDSEEIRTRLVNPECHIPDEAVAIHGITTADVADQPVFRAYASSLFQFFSDADIAGFNSNRFDLPLLVEEFARCGIQFPEPDCKLVDVQIIYHKKEPRTLAAALHFYCNKQLDGAHNAELDVRATLGVFKSQLERYDDIGTSIGELHTFCNPNGVVDFARYLSMDNQGVTVFNFGKHKGRPVVQEVEYARWMLDEKFPEATKTILRKLIGTVESPAGADKP